MFCLQEGRKYYVYDLAKDYKIWTFNGEMGAGKTTLLRILNQITKADEGTIEFNDEILAPQHSIKIGYLPEERGLYKKMKKPIQKD